MQELWNIVENQSVFVYFITGICLVGVLSRLILQGNFHHLLKASENMASATGRQLREIRNHYENSLVVDRQVHNIHAYVDKYLLKLKLCGIPIRIWAGLTMEAALLTVTFGGIGIINSIHKGYGEAVIFNILFATLISCACLLSMENIFRVENSYDRLQANIEDYLENNLRNRLERPALARQERQRRSCFAAESRQAVNMQKSLHPEAAVGQSEVVSEEPVMTVQQAGRAVSGQSVVEQPEAVSEEPVMAVQQAGRAVSGQSVVEQSEVVSEEPVMAVRQAAAGQESVETEAELVAQVLRKFFSS